ncbi:putative membrane protein YccC [Acinetobacter calcoaceticus]|uniref:Putative membrane protein YccC n=1 Tax=Acinetobacter calcoaceticus TaxID=471 RepID=A0A4R1Y7A2_ACICA|nr:putative membrane protein YccC [Acinetobacter calcoaceticus]
MLLIQQLFSFRPSKMALIFACKTFIAAMLALFISFELDLINPMWSIGTVLIIASPYSGMVSSKCIYRLLGTMIGALIALLLTPNLINTPWLFTLILSLWVGVALYVSLLDRTPRSYMFMLAGYTTAMIVFNAVTMIDQYSIFDLAIARVMEISIGVICSAVVSATIFPVHIGSAIKQRVGQALSDTEALFKDLLSETPSQNSPQILAALTRDSSEIHALAVHLNYEKGELKGTTKALQELLHQLSLVVSNLVALAERMQQLKQFDQISVAQQARQAAILQQLSLHIIEFLHQQQDQNSEHDQQKDQQLDLLKLPADFESYCAELAESVKPQQQVLVAAMKMDLRHFISNVLAVNLIWSSIQAGRTEIPAQINTMTTAYPSLHRDHGVAVRGGISAVLITFIVTAIWILSGWKAGFMMAQIGAVTACILTALDNPVPVLKIFIWGSLVSAALVFVYAFGIFPHVTAFWQLAVVLFPMVLISVSMMANQMLMPIGMVLGINTMMGLNLHNRYSMDAVTYFDTSMGMIFGVLVSLIVIDLVRAMSPDTSASRILSLHYRAIQKAITMPYGLDFKVHLRGMLDRIGVLNTKPIQSEALKSSIRNALIESSAVVDLTRLQELAVALPQHMSIQSDIAQLQQNLAQYFNDIASHLQADPQLRSQLAHDIGRLQSAALDIEDGVLQQRLLISLNNIQHSLCHLGAGSLDAGQQVLGEAIHG